MTASSGSTPGPRPDAAEVIKARLRADLRLAMRARASLEVGVLRALIAAVDNAQAVPIGGGHQRYVVHTFGDASAEVPRLMLDVAQVERLLEGEIANRRMAAEQFDALARPERAAELRAEAAVVARYAAL